MIELQKIKNSIDNLFGKLKIDDNYSDFDDVDIAFPETPDGYMLKYKSYEILRHLEDIKYILDYMDKPVKYEGVLKLNENSNYYELIDSKGVDRKEYHCGSSIEFLVYNNYYESEMWATSSVEHNGSGYYIVRYGKLNLDELKVRIRDL